MRNYRLEVDLLDVIGELITLDMLGYTMPFLTVFVEADNPDDACHAFYYRLKSAILNKDSSMEMRIFCRKITDLVRIDRIHPL